MQSGMIAAKAEQNKNFFVCNGPGCKLAVPYDRAGSKLLQVLVPCRKS